MNATVQKQKSIGMTRKQAAVIAGVSLLIMAVIAPIASFGILTKLVVDGDTASTIANIAAAKGQYIFVILCLFIVAILDVVIGLSLLVYFKPYSPALSQVQAWIRIIYAVAFFYAVVQLVMVFQVLETAPEEVLPLINCYHWIWQNALMIFGLHLIVLGIVVIQAGYMKKILGILVLIAGAGYLADGIIRIAMPESDFSLTLYTFVGELVLMLWLLIRGWKLAGQEQ